MTFRTNRFLLKDHKQKLLTQFSSIFALSSINEIKPVITRNLGIFTEVNQCYRHFLEFLDYQCSDADDLIRNFLKNMGCRNSETLDWDRGGRSRTSKYEKVKN